MNKDDRKGGDGDCARRPERILAWALIASGGILLLLYGIYKFLSRIHTITLSVRSVSIGLVIVGGIILFISVLAERLRERGTDRYRDIDR